MAGKSSPWHFYYISSTATSVYSSNHLVHPRLVSCAFVVQQEKRCAYRQVVAGMSNYPANAYHPASTSNIHRRRYSQFSSSDHHGKLVTQCWRQMAINWELARGFTAATASSKFLMFATQLPTRQTNQFCGMLVLVLL